MEVTFIVESGEGLNNSTSYVGVEEMRQYFFDKGYSYDSLTDNDIKRLLNKGTLYVDSNYTTVFPGLKHSSEQALSWPRNGAFYLDGDYPIGNDELPKEVKDAVCESANLINTGIDLFATIEKTGKVLQESVAADVIKQSTTYSEGSALYQPIYTIIDNVLTPITGGVSNNFQLSVVRVGGESP